MSRKKVRLLALAGVAAAITLIPLARPVASEVLEQACMAEHNGQERHEGRLWVRNMLFEWKADHPEATAAEWRRERALLNGVWFKSVKPIINARVSPEDTSLTRGADKNCAARADRILSGNFLPGPN